MNTAPEHDPARRRFFAIQAVRLSGVACVVVGMLTASERVPLPAWSGYLLIVIGLVGVFVIPTMLARKWRTP